MSALTWPVRLAPVALALWLAGCVNLAPDLKPVPLPVPAQLPANAEAAAGTAVQPAWQALLRDERLRQLVGLALANNRDLRVALLNVDRSRAQLRLTDADRYPTVSAALLAQRTPNTSGVQTSSYQAGLQVSNYELDLLGRLRHASDAAAANLLATEAAGRGVRLSLVVQTASAWLTLAADGEQLALARSSLASRGESLRLTTLREQVGAASGIELQAARTLSASARASVAQLERQLAQDRNALNVLVGTPVPDPLLPPARLSNGDWLASVPAGLSSDVLLKRPDVIQAEQALVAAHANIGAARAAMFPRITLSTSAGQVSSSLSTLFDAGHFAWTLAANAAVAVFDSGRNQANVDSAKLGRDIALAQYEKAVQTAFRDTADALVAQSSWTAQLAAQQDLVAAESERTRLTRMRLQAGSLSLLDTLDAERSLDSAQQALVQVRLAELLNRLSLYRALGGDEDRPTP
jgi:outer membrane protein, multidrug efflux system